MLISEAQERERERYICYCHKPIVQRWTTPSSSWRRWRCRWRRRRPLRQGSAGVFPSDLQPPGLCFLFLSCGGSPVENPRGTFYIGVFRSRGCFWAKDRRKRGHGGRNRWAHVAWYCSRVGPALLALRSPFVDFFCSLILSFQNND